jgi:hypothetical protein
MATTINSYSVGLGMDASGYIDGANLSRSETKKLVKDIEAARTPTENFAREQDRLTAALDKGAISQATYDRLLANKRASLISTTDLTHGYAIGLTAVAAAGAAVIAGGVAFIAHLRATQNQIDETIDSSKKLGMSFNEVGSIRFAAQEAGGTDSATVDERMKKMLVNISKAVAGDEGIREAFGKLGLDAGEMMKLGPVQAVMAIADGMEGVTAHADKLNIAMEIFGKAGNEIVPLLDQGSDAIRDSVEFQQKWNYLTESQTTAVAANNDAWDRIGVVIEGASIKLAAEFAPAMLLIAESILGIADSAENVDGYITTTVDSIVYMGGSLKENLHLLQDTAIVAGKLASFNFVGAGSDAATALLKVELDGGEKALQALYDKRFELDNIAKDNESKRIKNRIDTEAIMQESAAEKADKKQRERDAEKLERDLQAFKKQQEHEEATIAMQRQADREKAIREAQSFFEKQRREVAKGPGAGMEAGSVEAARFLADQVNQAAGDAINGNPTRQQMDMQLNKLDELITVAKNNGFRQI